MRARFLKYTLLAFVAMAAMACSNDWWDDQFGQAVGPNGSVCDAELVLNIGTVAEQTRVGIGGDNTPNSGDKMESLTMLLVRGDNTIEKRVDIDAVGSPTGFTGTAQTEATIKLTDVERGEHTIYLVANYALPAAYTEGANVATLGLYDTLLPTLSGTATPDHTVAMPLTAKLDVEFKQGSNAVSAEVERAYGRFGVTFYNHAVDEDYTVVVANAELSAFNASSGYLFNHDYTVPAGNTYRTFFADVSGSQRLDYGGTLTPIDTYLYETDENATHKLSFMVGVFQGLADGVTPTIGATTVVPDETNHDAILVGHQYLIYNPSRNVYLYMNGNNLALEAPNKVPTTNYENYLWEFSTTSAGKIRNVGTGRWISRTDASLSTTNTEGAAETFTMGSVSSANKTVYFRSSYTTTTGSGSWWDPIKTFYYFFNANSTSTVNLASGSEDSQSTSSNNATWTLREMKTTPSWSVPAGASLKAEAYHSANLTYINDLGSPAPLERIDRNQNLQVGVNIFYNPQTGSFNFDVVPWTNVNGDATFD